MNRNLHVYDGLGSVTLVPAGASLGKKGRGAGFYCATCKLTFKDNIQYVDHVNSKQHQYASGELEHSAKATLQQVLDRIEHLRARVARSTDQYDIAKRLDARRKLDAHERERRRKKRAIRAPDPPAPLPGMGFATFASTKRL